MRVERKGVALLEVLVSSVLLAMAASAIIAEIHDARASMRTVAQAERDVVESSDEMERIALLDRDSLSALLGWTERGRWSLHVERTADSLFDIALSDRPGARALLTTTLYRPERSDAR